MKILVAHNNPANMAMISLILLSQGHEVILAMTGDEAYGKAFILGIGAIIASRFLEGRTGPELIHDIRNSGINVPLLLIDSEENEEEEAELVVARVFAAIKKL